MGLETRLKHLERSAGPTNAEDRRVALVRDLVVAHLTMEELRAIGGAKANPDSPRAKAAWARYDKLATAFDREYPTTQHIDALDEALKTARAARPVWRPHLDGDNA
jgi:hypothetical protein